MYRIRIAPAAKLLLMPTVKNNLSHGSTNFLELMAPTCALVVCSVRNLQSTQPFYNFMSRSLNVSDGMIQRIWKKIDIFNPIKYKFNIIGVLLYEEIVDKINYNAFYEEFKMPDTFCSWFIVMELHVWMMMVRCMAEGKEGQILRNNIVQAMWDDVNARSKRLKTKEIEVNATTIKQQVVELSHQFNACIIAYDEGITADDKILAAAIWRRFLQSECKDPEMLEKLVFYVRKQTCLLETISWKELLKTRCVSWQGLDLIKSN